MNVEHMSNNDIKAVYFRTLTLRAMSDLNLAVLVWVASGARYHRTQPPELGFYFASRESYAR